MREIKFRAWETKENKMLSDHDLLEIRYGDIFEYELMQFTGLKDKNGKEIYEGEIVRINILDRIKVVVWDRGAYWLCKNTNPESWVWTLGESEFRGDLSDIEVIGNIYENPELLEVKK